MPAAHPPTPAELHQRTNAFARALTVSSSIMFAISLITAIVVMFTGGEPGPNETGQTTNFRGGFLIIVGAVTLWSLLMMLASHFRAITTPAPQQAPSQQPG